MVDERESVTAKLCAFARAWHSNRSREKIYDDYLAYDLMGKEEYDTVYDMISRGPLQENAIDEFGTYEYDKKSIERGKEEPVKVDDHAMDAIRYAVMGMWKYLKRWLPEAEDEEE